MADIVGERASFGLFVVADLAESAVAFGWFSELEDESLDESEVEDGLEMEELIGLLVLENRTESQLAPSGCSL